MTRKARNLEILRNHGISVPKGLTMDASHYRTAIELLTASIVDALPSSQRIKQIFLSAGMSTFSRSYLDTQLSLLAGVERFAVRSSGMVNEHGRHICEDSEEVSLAGQFESFLNVPRNHVPQAVCRCWASLFNERSIASFSADRDYVLSSTMSVVIQEMVPAKSSAVIMTIDPQGIGDIGGIEFTWGPCEAIVAGITSPDEVTFDRETGKILTTVVGPKERRVSYGVFSGENDNVRRVPTTPEERSLLSVNTITIKKMIDIGYEIELIFGRPQEIELVITSDDRIVITQARAITTLPNTITPFSILAAA
jgi:phosphoenolpyruvate synthase/pyruvate phosphate dikinase